MMLNPLERTATRFSLPIVAALMVACADGGAAGGGEWQGTVEDSAGVEIVTNDGSGAWGSDDAWTVEPDLQIGTAAGEAEMQFGLIAGIDIDSEGRIYVMDQQAQEVRVFSPDGDFVGRIGKAGSGPGELSQAAGPVFVGPGDTVQVPDVMQQRVNLYTASGEPVRSYPLPMSEGIPVRWAEDPDDRLIQQAMTMQMPGMDEVEPSNRLLRRDGQGQVVDTIMELPIGKTFSFSGGQPQIRMFESEPMWAIGPDGRLMFGNNSEYRFEVYSPEGDLVRIVQKSHQREPISESDRQEFRRLIRDAWERAGMPPQAIEQMGNAIQFAEQYPAYANLFGGPGGSMWVQGVQTPESVIDAGGTYDIQDIGGPTWDVFDDEGRYLGIIEMPGRFMPLLFDGDHIYGVLRDDMDVQYAARMRVNRGGGVEGE